MKRIFIIEAAIGAALASASENMRRILTFAADAPARIDPQQLPGKRRSGGTTAQDKRAAVKAANVRRNRAAHRA